jgi:hypothetical protein
VAIFLGSEAPKTLISSLAMKHLQHLGAPGTVFTILSGMAR